MPYDTEEAVHILADFLEERDPAYRERAAAAVDLLAEFAEVAKRAGYEIHFVRETATLSVSHSWGGHAFLFATDGGQIGIGGNGMGIGKRLIETIRFDRAAGMLTSTQQDAYRLPEPGEPQHQYRSALAELAEAVRDVMKAR